MKSSSNNITGKIKLQKSGLLNMISQNTNLVHLKSAVIGTNNPATVQLPEQNN
ncbi:MAG: hypothetical protein LBH18_05230 [Spirochaetaceae bacterium]|jgi:hypothetical protein|nr:hypothetical protein [Spirochaetaceae bacterium]